MAASLANGGLCPLSGDQVLSPAATRSMLSMMQVAGMKEYSSTFQFKVPSAEYKCQNTTLYSKLILANISSDRTRWQGANSYAVVEYLWKILAGCFSV